MTLNEFLSQPIDKDIFLLWFDNSEGVRSEYYEVKKISKIENNLLNKEVMEINDEDDCKEIWIR